MVIIFTPNECEDGAEQPCDAEAQVRLVISCSVTGDPEPRISWRRMSATTMTDLMSSSPVFIIERVIKKDEDEGPYSYLASNEAGR